MNLPTLPDVKPYTYSMDLCYTAEQIQAYGQQCRAEALEDAAKAIIEPIGYDNYTALRQAAEKIRSLK